MKIDVVTFGKAIRDIILETDQENFADINQEKIIVKQSHLDVGGGAANMAVGLTKLGQTAAPAVVVGEDPEGEEIINRLKRRSVDISMVTKNGDFSSGISVIIQNKNREHLAYVYSGANRLLDSDMIRWKEAAQAKYWYLLSVGNPDPELLNEIARQKESYNIRLVFNPGRLQLKLGQEKLSPILISTDILILNQSEAESLSGVEDNKVFKKLVGMGPKIIVVTRGKEGAACYNGKDLVKVGPYPKEKINAIGAGDAFGSGFLASFMESGDISQSLKWGIVNSAFVISKFGAQEGLLTKGEILKRIAGDKVEISKTTI
jgi:sugar/nucleoside kinase (ribokinase family)